MSNKIGRNDPCPCGSGKKYKKCCGAALATRWNVDNVERSIRFNQEIAYIGNVGRKRKEFCIQYYERKVKTFPEIYKIQSALATKRGQAITCHKGCPFCCNELVMASLGECELIVYYLYSHEEAMKAFVKGFPSWLERIQKHEDVFRRIEDARSKTYDSGLSEESMELLGKELQAYWQLQIPCPFLADQVCSIYEVRPWACSSVFSVTPSEWCNPINTTYEPKIYWSKLPLNVMAMPFYDEESSITTPDFNMPDTVYRILIGGFKYISEIPGLESLYQEVLHDEEIRRFVNQRY